MGDKVIEVKVRRQDKGGTITEGEGVTSTAFDFRISIYFSNNDYHIQFPQGADRTTIAKALYKLSENIRQGGTNGIR